MQFYVHIASDSEGRYVHSASLLKLRAHKPIHSLFMICERRSERETRGFFQAHLFIQIIPNQK